ncbi:PREDICTED: oleosin-B2 [Camelina sativa]|uniref:Oleosin-B2 n=1 Tax=Camelina sativa TaxID=90675 RepID=A0ABM0XUY5_CAMSA|nr:PREDICTED: oleosin-B2 [Camelina sativa]
MFSFLIPLLEVFKVVIAAVASIVFLGLSGLTFACSAAALTVTAPLFIIFSPILVPATIATAVLTSGFTAGSILGAMAIALISRRMGLKPTLFVRSLPTKTLFSLQPKINYDGTFKGSWGGGSSTQALSNFSYGGTWTATWGGRTFSGSFGDKSGGGSSSAPAGGSTPAPAPAAASTPAPAPAPAAASTPAPKSKSKSKSKPPK